MSETHRTRPWTGSRTGLWNAVLVFLGYALVLSLFNLEWIREASRSVIVPTRVSGPDARLHLWILWWVYHSLTTNPSGLLDAPINYPAQGQLTGSEHFLSSQILFAPVFWLTGNPLLGLNVVLLVSYPLAALAMDRLLLALGFHRIVAWGGGLLFALGSLSAPPTSHVLHYMQLFFPLVALAVLRLREEVSVRHAARYGVSLLLGFLSAYYLAAMLVISTAVWAISEALRERPGRTRFLLVVVGVGIVCLAILAIPSLAYLGRSEVWSYSPQREKSLDSVQNVIAYVVLYGPLQTFGLWASILALIGLAGLADRELRRTVVVGLAILAAGLFLAANGSRLLEALDLPGPLGSLAAIPARFFRMTLRFTVLAAFGVALLAAVGLELAARRLPRGVATAAIGLVLALLLWERGSLMAATPIEPVYAAWRDVPIYREVGRVIAENGAGPLLELPTRNRGWNTEAEAMVGAIWHGMPLIIGHTGYLPPHREAVNEAIRALPSPEALDQLMRTTGLRWILIRPADHPMDQDLRRRLVRLLRALPPVTQAWSMDGWFLLELDPSRPGAGEPAGGDQPSDAPVAPPSSTANSS